MTREAIDGVNHPAKNPGLTLRSKKYSYWSRWSELNRRPIDYESIALPLSYIGEYRRYCLQFFRDNIFTVVARGGIEPPTLRFSVVCSTN